MPLFIAQFETGIQVDLGMQVLVVRHRGHALVRRKSYRFAFVLLQSGNTPFASLYGLGRGRSAGKPGHLFAISRNFSKNVGLNLDHLVSQTLLSFLLNVLIVRRWKAFYSPGAATRRGFSSRVATVVDLGF